MVSPGGLRHGGLWVLSLQRRELLLGTRNNEALYVPCRRNAAWRHSRSSKRRRQRDYPSSLHGLGLSLIGCGLFRQTSAVLYRVAGQRLNSVAADIYRL
jgi:hypothetical protein